MLFAFKNQENRFISYENKADRTENNQNDSHKYITFRFDKLRVKFCLYDLDLDIFFYFKNSYF